MVQRDEKTKKESILFRRLQHNGINGGFDFETKNKKDGKPIVVAWGMAFYAKNWKSKTNNHLFKNKLIEELIAKKDINVERVTRWYKNGDKGKFKYKAYIVTGANIDVFFHLLNNALKNIRLVGQYNCSFDNSFIYELGKMMDYFNHIEHVDKDEIILKSKAYYLEQLEKHQNPKAKGTLEVLKVNGKYYRMVWLNENKKTIIFDDDWLINSFGLPMKGKIIGMAKRGHEDFEKIPFFEDAVQLKESKEWYEYLIYDVMIVHIYQEITLETWSDKLGGYNNVKLTKSSNAFAYHKKTFTETAIDEMIKEKVISKPVRRNVWRNSKKEIKVCDILNRQVLSSKYHITSKKPYIKYNNLKTAIWKDYHPTNWLAEEKFYIAQDLQDWKIGGMVHLNDTVFKDDCSYLVCANEKKSQFKIAKIDINSSYPSVMCSESVLCPYGEPIKCNKLDLKKYQLIRVSPKYYIKKDPFFMPMFVQKVDGKNKWVHSLIKDTDYYIDTNMWAYFKEHYNIKAFEIEYCYTFKAKSMAFFFANTILPEYANKSKWKGVNEALYQQIKIILNSIFGKYVTKWRKKESFHDEDKDKNTSYEFYIKGEYIPIGIAILNAARMKLCNVVNNKYRYFKYCDTDSLCLLIPSEVTDYDQYFLKEWNLVLDDTKLGDWDLEGVYILWGFFQPKAYLVANPFNGKNIKEAECIRKRAGYKYPEYNRNDNSMPMIGSKAWKRYCRKKNVRIMIGGFIDGCLIPNQMERKYMHNLGVRLIKVTKEIKPIYDSYLKMSREEYFAKHVIM